MKQRGLQLNEDKSFCVIMGSKKQKREASEEIDKNPLRCGSFNTKEVQVDIWLGQQLSSLGIANSMAKTVGARKGKIKAACFEIAQIVNDWRAQAVGGMVSALFLWEACCIPSLLHGAGTWVEMSEKTEKTLNSLQQWFVRLILHVGPGAPIASLLWDNCMLDMGLRIWVEKLMLVLHVRKLGEETLANQVYMEQRSQEWPGLADEADKICIELGIESVHVTDLCSRAYRALAIKACHLINETRIKKQAEGKDKCAIIFKEQYGSKDYLKNSQILKVRQTFRTRFGMQPFAGNYSHDRRFARTDWLCRCLKAREDESHLITGNCEVFGNMRRKYGDLSEEENLVKFFTAVLSTRDKLDNVSS